MCYDEKLPRCSFTPAKAGARKGENPPAGVEVKIKNLPRGRLNIR